MQGNDFSWGTAMLGGTLEALGYCVCSWTWCMVLGCSRNGVTPSTGIPHQADSDPIQTQKPNTPVSLPHGLKLRNHINQWKGTDFSSLHTPPFPSFLCGLLGAM